MEIMSTPVQVQSDEATEAKDRISHLSALLRVISDENRLRILGMLMQRELCVCELMGELGLSQSLVSHHLGMLKNAGLVRDRRDAQWVYYSIDSCALAQLSSEYLSFFDVNKLGPESRPGCNTRCLG